jgi:hypothetical protein
MPSSRLFRVVIAAVSISMVAGVGPARADTINPPLPDLPSTSSREGLAISVSHPMGVKADTRRAIESAARSVGAEVYPGRAVTLGLTRMSRGQRTVQRVRRGWRIPMSTVAHHDAVVRSVMGGDIADVLLSGRVVMGESSAGVRRAQVGDVVTLVGKKPRLEKSMSTKAKDKKRPVARLEIGAIVDDELVGGADLLVSMRDIEALGATLNTRYTMIGFRRAADAQRALADVGVVNGLSVRVRATWDAPNPDATMGLGVAKAQLGEFAYTIDGKGRVRVDPGWTHRNITPRQNFEDIQIRAACHREIWTAIQGALTEIRAAGWSRLVDVENANRYGGCHYARLNRIAEDLEFLSRHSWAMALDFNTTTNAQGRPPNMPCGIVRIFRKWGFAWGGNFTPADGMHFEYVGERRDNIAFPSRYCPNIIGGDG